jgi:hypothetical protein
MSEVFTLKDRHQRFKGTPSLCVQSRSWMGEPRIYRHHVPLERWHLSDYTLYPRRSQSSPSCLWVHVI